MEERLQGSSQICSLLILLLILQLYKDLYAYMCVCSRLLCWMIQCLFTHHLPFIRHFQSLLFIRKSWRPPRCTWEVCVYMFHPAAHLFMSAFLYIVLQMHLYFFNQGFVSQKQLERNWKILSGLACWHELWAFIFIVTIIWIMLIIS